MSKGYASEALILGGCFLVSENLGLAITLVVLGVLAAITRFALQVSFNTKKQEWYDTLNGIIKQIASIPIEKPRDPLSIFKGNEEVH
jgi:hypothetical protein